MPYYFFHVRDHGVYTMDHEGLELPDVETARKEAEAAARDMLGEKLRAGELLDHEQFEITDEQGNIVLIVPVKSVMKLPRSS